MLKTHDRFGFLRKLLVVCFLFSGIFVSGFKVAQADVSCNSPWYMPWTDAQRAAGCAGREIKKVSTNRTPPSQRTLKDAMSLLKKAQKGSIETGYLIVKFKDGTERDYRTNGDSKNIDFTSAANAVLNDAKKFGGVDSITDMHNHPFSVAADLGISSYLGYPPSTQDLVLDIGMQSTFPGAKITTLAIDGFGNVWQASVPANSQFAKDYATGLWQSSAAGAQSSDSKAPFPVGSFGTVTAADLSRVGDYNTGVSTTNYINAAQKAGVSIVNVNTQYFPQN